ncbi:hypothetical protein ABZ354_03270 [Streptomyces sp. NPDC005925]|uniref:hypothetical protein n=1 Tax=Streptomyces sp. NPDC005925 TaxID=3157172 RepID=UPI0033E89214
MGAFTRMWRGPVAAAGFAVVAVTGAVACDPVELNAGAVAYTTDQTVTRELERQKADVRWLTCRATYDEDGGDGRVGPTPSGSAVASVDCEGETGDGKDITVRGKVTRSVRGACVRGDLTAKVDGKVWFHVDGLGNCDATTPPPVADHPGGGGARPAATVTVTRTVWCRQDPNCRPVEGK